MQVNVCDVCGAYPAEKFGVTSSYVYTGVDNMPEGIDFDLCPTCQAVVLTYLLKEMECKPEAQKFNEWFRKWQEAKKNRHF